MFIDILFVLILLFALFKGLKRGLIVALFSLFALLAGLAAAIKLSAVVAVYLAGTVNIAAKWLPILSFLLVFIAVILVVRWAASLLEAAVNLAMLGWVNKIGGVLLYMLIYLTIFSVILFYATKAQILTDKAIASSTCYSLVEPFGPKLINAIARLVPIFKDMFTQLENFFAGLAQKGS